MFGVGVVVVVEPDGFLLVVVAVEVCDAGWEDVFEDRGVVEVVVGERSGSLFFVVEFFDALHALGVFGDGLDRYVGGASALAEFFVEVWEVVEDVVGEVCA